MKAVILCAGRGVRLNSYTKNIPKPLIKIGKQSLLKREVLQLKKFGVTEIYILVGYKKDLIKKELKGISEVKYIHNPLYSSLNNLFSVWLIKPYLYKQEFLLLNGDIIFEDSILKQSIDSPLDNFCVIDTTLPLPADSMKVLIKNGVIKDFSKKLTNGNGYTMGIHKFSQKGSSLYLDELERMIEGGMDDYHHTAILHLSKEGFKQKALEIRNLKWCEIDEEPDIEMAKSLFENRQF